VSALVLVPRSNDVDWLGLARAAPDAGGLLLAVAVQAVLWAMLRAAAWLQQSNSANLFPFRKRAG